MRKRVHAKEILFLKFPIVLTDIASHFSVFAVLVWFTPLLLPEERDVIGEFSVFLLLLAAYIMAIAAIPLKLSERHISYGKTILRAVGQSFTTTLAFAFLVYVFYRILPAVFYLCQGACAIAVITVVHLIFRKAISMLRKAGRNQLRIVMVGADANLVHIYNVMMRGYGVHGYNVLGFFTERYKSQIPEGETHLGNVSDAVEYIRNNDIDEVFCSINPSFEPELVNSIIKVCNDRFIQFWFVPHMNGYPHHRMKFQEFDRVNVISLYNEPLSNPWNRACKRAFDIVSSGLFLLLVYPWVWAIVALCIKVTSPGPVLFRQKRTGYSGQEFWCLKFRSMKVNADADSVQATQDDPRKTRFGNFIRKTSIDELPQFINVFRGDMSMVGPRPHMEYHTEMYSQLISDYMVRHLAKPGITGWAQVNGCRGETKTVEQMKERVEHDIWYIEHYSFWLDIKIMIMTLLQVVRGDEQAY